MNQRDRDRITVSYEKLASQIDMITLWPKLLENKIFESDECSFPTWRKNLNSFETKKDIVLAIKTRGPDAFKNFLLSLRQSGHDTLATYLNGSEIKCNSQLDEQDEYEDEKEYEEDNENDSFNRFLHEPTPLEIVVKKSKKFLDGPAMGRNDMEKYIMRSKPRGLVLIVCNIEYITLKRREGAQHDENNLKKLFEDMGFEVTLASNLTGAQIRKVTKEFAAKKEFRKVDSCFVIFSCHGGEAGKNWDAEVQGIDYQKGSQTYEKIYCSEITEFFNSKNCKNLIGKPKVFIFQMCRGETHQVAVSRHATDGVVIVPPNYKEEESDLRRQSHRNYANTLIAHATVPGHYSYRDTINGTWCIQVLCEVFMKEAHRRHLTDLFNIIDKRLESLRTEHYECQTLTVTNMGFNKHCYLNPGLFEAQ